MNLYEIIKLKYPDIDFMSDVLLQDDGQGPYIRYWNLADPKPSTSQLEKWSLELEDLRQFQLNKILNEEIHKKLEEIDLKSIRALRTNDIDRLQDLETQAIALRLKLLPVE